MYTIRFSFEEKNRQPITIEDVVSDQSLLEIAEEKGIELHHNCGGVCACSTCHIYIEKGSEFVEEISDKEDDFIDRARNPKLTSRLACQSVLLLHEEGGILDVTIPDQSVIQGE